MQLHLLPTDSTHRFTWTIFYGEDTIAGKRDYELVILDAAKGLYAIDEKNTIVMEAYLLGGKLYNQFEVAGNLLLCTTELVSGNLVFEVISGKLQAVSKTGNQKFKEEDIPPVKAYPVMARQVAVLKKRNKLSIFVISHRNPSHFQTQNKTTHVQRIQTICDARQCD